MRWRITQNQKSIGDTKIRKVFLFVPCSLGGEVRWLELVKIKYVYKYQGFQLGWFPLSWED